MDHSYAFMKNRLLLEDKPAPFPVQDLRSFDKKERIESRLDWVGMLRRFFVFGASFALTGYLTYQFYYVLAVGGLAALEYILLGLFVINIFWLSLSFVTALAGFAVLAFGLRPSILKTLPEGAIAKGKTAVLICTYNEPPERVFGVALAAKESLAEEEGGERFDVFVLSDTTNPDIWIQEEAAFQAARARSPGGPQLYYRRRSNNAGKKAGNVGEWCRRWGGAYDYMVVYDADSLMTGETLITLAASMEAHPDVGLIQTSPVSINRQTLFARMQQFATRVYGPVITAGLAFWHRGSSNFWGHNAIIRVKAFCESSGLPHLPGKPPFGGQILSHDFVEAALLRRRGWRVCMAPELKGSYEETPPTVIDFAIRDRRWCQGNLQHSRILTARGLSGVSRVHLLMGIMSYLSASVWLLFLIAALALTLQAQYTVPEYFTSEFPLFPTWPMQDSERAMSLLFMTLGLLLLPKLGGFALVVSNTAERKAHGGWKALTVSMLIETVLSSLFAHVMMLVQTSAIVDILRGRDSGWNAQRRDDGSLPLRVAMYYHSRHMLIGACLAVMSFMISGALFLWLLPASLGLLLSGPISAFTSRRTMGVRSRRSGLFLIPEEMALPPIARQAWRHSNALAHELKPLEALDAFEQLSRDPVLRNLHRELVRLQPMSNDARFKPSFAVGKAKLQASQTLDDLSKLLNVGEKAALLSDLESFKQIEELIKQDETPSPVEARMQQLPEQKETAAAAAA
jgi:membrane glycosyltransferase